MNIRHIYLDIAGWRIHCAFTGDGPPILMLHGLGASWQWWLPAMRDLIPDYTVYAIDMPGAGESSPVLAPPTGEGSALLISEIMESLGLSSAAVVAHSLGAYVALQAAIRRVSGIGRLAVVAPAGVGDIKLQILRIIGAPLIGEALQLWVSRVGLRVFLRSLVYNPESITDEVLGWTVDSQSKRTNRKQFLYQLRLASNIQSIDDALAEHGSPADSTRIQIYWGRHDPLFPVSYAFRLSDRLNAQPPKVFEHSGHIPQIEEIETFNLSLRNFLQGI